MIPLSTCFTPNPTVHQQQVVMNSSDVVRILSARDGGHGHWSRLFVPRYVVRTTLWTLSAHHLRPNCGAASSLRTWNRYYGFKFRLKVCRTCLSHDGTQPSFPFSREWALLARCGVEFALGPYHVRNKPGQRACFSARQGGAHLGRGINTATAMDGSAIPHLTSEQVG